MIIQNPTIEITAGDAAELRVQVLRPDNQPANLSGLSARFRAARAYPRDRYDGSEYERRAAIDKQGQIEAPSSGEVRVSLASADTAALEGEHAWQLATVDGAGEETVVSAGRIRILRRIEGAA